MNRTASPQNQNRQTGHIQTINLQQKRLFVWQRRPLLGRDLSQTLTEVRRNFQTAPRRVTLASTDATSSQQRLGPLTLGWLGPFPPFSCLTQQRGPGWLDTVSPSAPVPSPWPKACCSSSMSRQRTCLRTEPRTWVSPHLVMVTATFAGAWAWTPMAPCTTPRWRSTATSLINLPEETVGPQKKIEPPLSLSHSQKRCFPSSRKHQNPSDSTKQASPTPSVTASQIWPAPVSRLLCSWGPKTW